jgi:hypothetical protein
MFAVDLLPASDVKKKKATPTKLCWIYVGNDNDWLSKREQKEDTLERIVSPGQGHTLNFRVSEIKSLIHDSDPETGSDFYTMQLDGKTKYHIQVVRQFEDRVSGWAKIIQSDSKKPKKQQKKRKDEEDESNNKMSGASSVGNKKKKGE